MEVEEKENLLKHFSECIVVDRIRINKSSIDIE